MTTRDRREDVPEEERARFLRPAHFGRSAPASAEGRVLTQKGMMEPVWDNRLAE
jgi:hypothetical protein